MVAQLTSTTSRRPRLAAARLVAFRVVVVLVALLHLVAFGAWRAILTPWLVMPDDVDHGWTRTPELHRLADTASALIFVAIAAAALVLAVRPLRRTGLAAWLALALVLTGALAWASALLQGHDGVGGTVVLSIAWVAVVALVFGVLHPEGRSIVRGGVPQPGGRPAGVLRGALVAVAAAGTAVVVLAVGWRLSGGTFESPFEDDVLGLTYLGILWCAGALTALRGRQGWRPLSAILLGGAIYALVAGVTLAVG